MIRARWSTGTPGPSSSMPSSRSRRHAGADADLPKAQPVGVFQQVAEQLHQRALFHRYDTGARPAARRSARACRDRPVQCAAQAVEQRPQFDPVAHQAALAEAGTLQLIADLLAHALDLRLHHLRLLAALALRRERLADALQHAERGFQAVRQIGELRYCWRRSLSSRRFSERVRRSSSRGWSSLRRSRCPASTGRVRR